MYSDRPTESKTQPTSGETSPARTSASGQCLLGIPPRLSTGNNDSHNGSPINLFATPESTEPAPQSVDSSSSPAHDLPSSPCSNTSPPKEPNFPHSVLTVRVLILPLALLLYLFHFILRSTYSVQLPPQLRV